MKVLLVKPESRFPAIGLASIAASIEKNHEVKILDLGIYGNNLTDKNNILLDYIVSFSPEIVGITALSNQWKKAAELGSLIKMHHPNITTIYGGVHVSHAPRTKINNEFIDYIIVGEGEVPFRELIDILDKTKITSNIPGVMYEKGGEIIYTPQKNNVNLLDNLPMPAYHLLDIDRYQELGQERFESRNNGRYMPIITTRGCPFACIYCNNYFGQYYRSRDVNKILNEITYLHTRYNIGEFHFEDDNFNANADHAKKLMKTIIRSGLKIQISFPNGTRADNFDEELVILMKKAGTIRVFLSFDTMSERLQKYTKKNLNLKDAINAMYLFKKHQIETYGYFMLGFPTETKKELWKSITFAVKSPLSMAIFGMVSPNPGTQLFDMAIKKGYIKDSKAVFSHFNATMDLENFSAKELDLYRAKANLLCLLYPPRLVALLLNARNSYDFIHYFKFFKSQVLDVFIKYWISKVLLKYK